MHSVVSSAVLHQSLFTAGLREKQICICVHAVTQGCYQSVLQDSAEPQAMHSVLSRCCNGITFANCRLVCKANMRRNHAVTQGCCLSVLQSCAKLQAMHSVLNSLH